MKFTTMCGVLNCRECCKVRNHGKERSRIAVLLGICLSLCWPVGVATTHAESPRGSVDKPGFSFHLSSLLGLCVFRVLLYCFRFKYVISHLTVIPKVRVPVAYKFTLDMRNIWKWIFTFSVY